MTLEKVKYLDKIKVIRVTCREREYSQRKINNGEDLNLNVK